MSAAANLLLHPSTRDDDQRTLLVAEQFGPTFQGEGPSTGQQALFIRLSRCNLTCSWCDSAYTWDWTRYSPQEQSARIPVDELVAWALGYDTDLVVITGGEPLLQQPGVSELARALSAAGRRIEIETNGTIAPAADLLEAVTRLNVSVKLSGAQIRPSRRINAAALAALAAAARDGKAVFKFVLARPEEEIEEIVELEERFGLAPIWLMPEGTTEAAVLAGGRALADVALARGWNLTTRLHVLLWGDVRGR